MKDIVISFNCRIPDNITENQFEEWVKFAIIQMGSIENNNPLCETAPNELITNYQIWWR